MSAPSVDRTSILACANLSMNFNQILLTYLHQGDISEAEKKYLRKATSFIEGIFAALGKGRGGANDTSAGIALPSSRRLDMSLFFALQAWPQSEPFDLPKMKRTLDDYKDLLGRLSAGDSAAAGKVKKAANFFEQYHDCVQRSNTI